MIPNGLSVEQIAALLPWNPARVRLALISLAESAESTIFLTRAVSVGTFEKRLFTVRLTFFGGLKELGIIYHINIVLSSKFIDIEISMV
jgi:hypothetical protein